MTCCYGILPRHAGKFQIRTTNTTNKRRHPAVKQILAFAIMSSFLDGSVFSGMVAMPSRDPNVSNTRLHVKLNQLDTAVTRIMSRKHWGGKAVVVEKTLGGLWSSLGSASDVFYDDDFTFCFLSFSTHDEAAKALADLNNQSRLQTMAIVLVQVHPEGSGARKIAEQILGHLILSPTPLACIKRASWAHPRRPRDDRHCDDFDERDYYDDCPDGEDRFVWNEYCAGRDH